MNLEARFIDADLRDRPAEHVLAIWCELNGRWRRFTVGNVRETQAAGYRFYMRNAVHERVEVHVVGQSSTAHLHTDIEGVRANGLTQLPVRDRG